MDDFEAELKLGFLDEAAQLLSDAELSLLTLEQEPENEKIIDQLFRLAHNLKGSSKAVGFPSMGELTHRLESLLLKIKSKEMVVRTDTVNLFLRSLDALQKSVVVFKADLNGTYDFAALTAEVEAYLANANNPPPETVEAAPPAEGGGWDEAEAPIEGSSGGFEGEESSPAPSEDPFQSLSSVVEQSIAGGEPPAAPAFTGETEGVPSSSATAAPTESSSAPAATSAPASKPAAAPAPKAAAAAPAGGGGQAGGASAAAAVDESIRVSLGRIERLINYVGELVIFQTVLKEQVHGNNPLLLKKTADQLGKVTKEVQSISLSLRMVPMKQTFQKMQRIVRDTSSTLGKKINLILSGENTELDKTVLEYISDPLLHLIRNACDHGIEATGAERVANGKSEAGTIHLRAFHQGGNIILEVQDDGGGMSPEELKKKAIKKGLIKEGTVMSEKEALQIIFLPGFSTKAVVTDISGRGVGLDVVKNNITKLQGDIQLTTVLGKGTTFSIKLPLTMAIIDAMVVRMDQDRFVIPLGHIHESLKPKSTDIQSITGVGEVFTLRGENLPLYHLSRLLGRKGKETLLEDSILIVVRSGKAPFTVLVDDIIGQQQVVIKRLGKELQFLSGYSGSAILGDGKPALILELPEMLKTYKPDFAAASAAAAAAGSAQGTARRVAA
jgi:two-component system chemotaxis sensor kinase CheA